jgi:RNA-directed DNA polymerase
MKRTGTKSSKREGGLAGWPENGHAPAAGNVGNTERGGIESQARSAHDENAGEGTMKLMEEVLRKENIWKAYKRVKGNKGAPGVDKMTVDELGPFCKAHWEETRDALLNETYLPSPVKKVEISKPFGPGTRMPGIPTVLDRMIQQAIMQVLTPIYDPTFSKLLSLRG